MEAFGMKRKLQEVDQDRASKRIQLETPLGQPSRVNRPPGLVEKEIDKKLVEALLLDIAEGNNDEDVENSDWFGDVDDLPAESHMEEEKEVHAKFEINYSKASLIFNGPYAIQSNLEE